MSTLFVRTLLTAIILAMTVSCGSHSENGAAGAKHYLVAFSQANNAEPYRAAQNQLMQKLFAQYPDVHLVIDDAQQDNSKQIAQIETFIRQKPDLLIVAPNERAPLTEVMGRAMAAGIPVICLERDITRPNYTTFIGADNLAIGKMERYNGAHDVLKAYPDIRVVHEAVADWLQSNARERMLEILRAQAEIDVV